MTSTTPAIELRDVGVRYKLHRERVYSLKEAAIGSFKNVFARLAGKETCTRSVVEDFWAIRHMNLKVARGTSVGLTGRNGSGKSTTLKVISGVLHPTEGEYWVRGRVSALVELGAGFDPELTGRENIFLGASVAGLSRKEVEKRISRIVEFSELGDFIDVPVKNYSSGMYAKLGFSVATDVDPDLLIVDEILAVGDEQFQRKCFDRMQDFKRAGKTILYVSHDSKSVEAFCDRIVRLDGGHVVEDR